MSKTFEFQRQLNSLPMPNLNESGMIFLDWVEPLVTTEQLNTTKNTLKKFMLEDGFILHKKLEEWSNQNEGNWLNSLWQDMYLDIRDPLVINVNYFVKLVTDHLKTKYTSSDVAGVIINKLMDIYEDITLENFEPEKVRDNPLCMTQYKKMFKATRIPKLNRDDYIVKSKTKSNHIIVMFKSHMFKVNLSDASGTRYSCKMIINTLNNLMDFELEANDTSMGIITTAPRDQAAVLLKDIISFDRNSENFDILQDALFVVCIDENTKTLYEFAMSLFGTNENNRYFDKSLQLILNKNGDFGFNFEHTAVDASSWINIISNINAELSYIDKYIEDISTEIIRIEQLHWHLPTRLKSQLNQLRIEHNAKLKDIHLEIIHFENFGGSKIKSLKYSPDAFLHLALQLAQYRTFNKLRSTYEAVSTRGYLNGRTECNRPISMDVLNFVRAFDKHETDITTLKQLMSTACQKHNSRIIECQGSKGIERYFFAMKSMYHMFSDELNLKELPEFFNDEGYKQLIYSFISTSRIESKYFEICGFGPVVSDGYGFWYNLLENKIGMSLTTSKGANVDYVKSFADSIVKSLNDLAKLTSE